MGLMQSGGTRDASGALVLPCKWKRGFGRTKRSGVREMRSEAFSISVQLRKFCYCLARSAYEAQSVTARFRI